MSSVSKVEDILQDISSHSEVWLASLSALTRGARGSQYDVWLSAYLRIRDAANMAERGQFSAEERGLLTTAAGHIAPVIHHIRYALEMEHDVSVLRDDPDNTSYFTHEKNVLDRLDALIKAQDGIPMLTKDWVLPVSEVEPQDVSAPAL